jgi:acyl-CoA dehydrogenase
MSHFWTPEQHQIRDSVTRLCQRFDDQYWLDRDTDGVFPEDFCRALADDGWMGIAMPEEYGGSGLGITEAAVMVQAATPASQPSPSVCSA